MFYRILHRGFWAAALVLGLFSASAAHAGTAEQATGFSARLMDLNRLPPLKNPNLFRSADFLGRRIADKTGRVIGQTSDLLVGPTGAVETIVATLDQVGIGAQTLYFDLETLPIRSGADSYALPMHRNDIRRNLPDFLAGIESAGGEGEPGLTSVDKMTGAKVSGADGTWIGVVETVLMGDSARQIIGLGIRHVPSGPIIAIPFDRSFSIQSDFGALRIVVPADQAKTIVDYIRTAK